MKSLKILTAVAAFVATSAFAPVSTAKTQDMILMCPNGEVAELICIYTRNANGEIVVQRCYWSC